MRVCFVRHSYDDCPRAFRNARQLAERGHEVEYVCLRRDGEPANSTIDGVRVRRVRLTHRRGGTLRYLFEYGWFFLSAMFVVTRSHLRRRFDVVQVHTLPDALVFCALPARLLGARVVLDLQECMPEFFAVKRGVPMTHRAVRLLAWVEQRAIAFADLSMTCTTQMLDAFVRRGAERGRFVVITNSADESRFPAPDDHRPASGGFRLVTHGSLVGSYDLETVIRAVALVPETGVVLDIYGDGEDRPALETLRDSLSLRARVRFLGRVPHAELIAGLRQADAGIVAVQRNAFRDLTHCMKMFEYVRLGIPVLCAETPAVRDYFDETCFEYFTASDPADLAAAIVRSAQDPQSRARKVAAANERNEEYAWRRQGPQYSEAVESLAGAQSGTVAQAGQSA